jgi:uncharacterized protein YeeX (DUF496 family)
MNTSKELLLDRVVALAKECVESDRKILELQQEVDVLKNIVQYLIANRKVDDHA